MWSEQWKKSKDLTTLSFDQLMGSLQSHESRVNSGMDKEEERAFQAREEDFSLSFRRRGRSFLRGRGRGICVVNYYMSIDGEIIVRPIKSDEIEYEGESHLLGIPFPILEMIMELCVGVEYMNFRATCKHCHLAAPPIQWSSKTTLKRLQMYSFVSPFVMILDKNRFHYPFYRSDMW